ncbi:hypothetical protein FQN54_007984 [Arachnomyces sp. PD_36]|nr:hypothetical protein FQN54_007984 [Arachnomyces sp. PD_36]
MADAEDPLIKALPPATDYLTYLTLLEYQLTPARLPTLHKVLQDETLTTNIGWDLVQLLLPLLPASRECLQDIARLGNPREVILRVSEALMQLQPTEDDASDIGDDGDENQDQASQKLRKDLENAKLGGGQAKSSEQELPLHIMQFNCLMSMLSVLHNRIQAKYPSRFVATSLQAALEAYTSMPTSETTAAFLELFMDLSGRKRPGLPPRGASEHTIVHTSSANSAPDPEAEDNNEPSLNEEQDVINRLLQFGLIELLKAYLLSFGSQSPPGMDWTLRLQEKLSSQQPMSKVMSCTELFASEENLKERDINIGKITVRHSMAQPKLGLPFSLLINFLILIYMQALSRDIGLESTELIDVISRPSKDQLPPLDFENVPSSPADIPLERHGCLLLLAARYATTILFQSGRPVVKTSVYPDLAKILFNFLGQPRMPQGGTFSEPDALADSLLTLVVLTLERPVEKPESDEQFENFVLSLVACSRTPRLRRYNRIERLAWKVFHGNPSSLSRLRLVRKSLEDPGDLRFAREPAIGWIKDEILSPNNQEQEQNVFLDQKYIASLFPLIYDASDLPSSSENEPTASSSSPFSPLTLDFLEFTQKLAPYHLAALNLYYLLTQSKDLRNRLEVPKLDVHFFEHYKSPLLECIFRFIDDRPSRGGNGVLEKELGEEAAAAGMQYPDLAAHTLGLLEDSVTDMLIEAQDE